MRAYLPALLLVGTAMAMPQPAVAQSFYARSQVQPVKRNAENPNPPIPSAPATWVTGDWGSFSSSCSSAATRTRVVECRLNGGQGAPTADANCSASRPESSQTSEILQGCTYEWIKGEWSAWTSTCSESATRTRAITCERSDGAVVSDQDCAAKGLNKPASSQTDSQYTSCSYQWIKTYSACSPSQAGVRDEQYECRRSGNSIPTVNVTDPYSLERCGTKPAILVPDNSCTGPEALVNGDFERCTTSGSGWDGRIKQIVTGASAISGNCSATLNPFNDGIAYIQQTVALVPGAKYLLSIKHKAMPGAQYPGVWVQFISGFTTVISQSGETNGGGANGPAYVSINTTRTGTVTAIATGSTGVIKIQNTTTGVLAVDDITLQRVP